MDYPVTGVIQEIVARPTRIGDMYDVVVDGKKYGHGKYAPRGFKSGDTVEFVVEVKQNGQYTNYDIKRGTLRASTGGPAPVPMMEQAKSSADLAPSYAGATIPKSGYVAFDERQKIISTQSALNSALAFCTLAAAQGAVPVAKSGKAADQLSLYRQWVYDEAQRFYKLSTDRDLAIPESAEAALEGAVEKAKKVAAKATPAPEATGDSGYDEYPAE